MTFQIIAASLSKFATTRKAEVMKKSIKTLLKATRYMAVFETSI